MKNKITTTSSLSDIFKETDIEIVDETNIHSSVRHAINKIQITIKPPVKIQLNVHIEYTTEKDEKLPVWVSTRQQSIINDEKNWSKEMFNRFITASDEAKLRGSGWSQGRVLEIKLKETKFNPIAGKSFIPLPKELILKRAVLNIKNTDNRCFMWCVLAKLHYVKKNPERVSNYQQYVPELNFSNIDFPVTLDQIGRFESQNEPITVNVYTWSAEDNLQPIRISDRSPTIGEPHNKHVDLLLATDGAKQHYTLIRTMSRLMKHTTKDHLKQDFCRRCLLRMPSVETAVKHREHCMSITDCYTKLIPPKPGSKVSFKNFKKLQTNPYVVYADFESLIVPYEGPHPKVLPKTVLVNNHQICSYAFIIVRSDGEHSVPELYRGPDAAQHFLKRMMQIRNRLSNKLNLSVINMTPEDEEKFRVATHCWICRNKLTDETVRDHDHISGRFRGAAHNDCNLQLKFDPKTWKLPIFFHNLRGYDSHLIMQAVTDEFQRVSCIAQSSEKYMTFTLNQLSFYDSAQHMMGSLEALAASLSDCSITKEYFDQTLVRKGVYPYEYMDSWERFDDDALPPKGAFFSSLKGKDISDEDYQHALVAWQQLECKTMGDYHDAYLMADVCLLADVFENYRKTCKTHYELDPSHYISAPGMSWDAFLRFTSIQIDLLSELPVIQMIEDGLRGGISMVSHNFCKANNKYLDDYDPSKPPNYIMYLDANNLYGWAMSQALPLRNFNMLTGNLVCEEVIEVLQTMGPNHEVGWILEVDLEYPDELHDWHNDYPMAAERLQLPGELPKLIPNLRNKTKYVCHYRLLQFYLRHGLRLTAVHRIISFEQSRFMEPYIMKNTDLRTKATGASEKDFFKLMNNSCFGKTMENPHKRKDVRLVTKENQAIALSSKPQYQDFKRFNDYLYGIMMKQTKVKLDKPVFIGFSVLELSKLLMLEFLYDYFKPKYPESRVLYTDTDSFVMSVPTADFYKDMEGEGWYDTSDYPKDSPLYSDKNKKVIGKMKDEMNGTIIKEYVGLRAKMYSIASQKSVIKKAKGISKPVVKMNISHDNYKEALFDGKTFEHNNVKLTSKLHQISTTTVTKKSLDANNTKRVFVDPEFSYAVGHKKIRT